MSALSVLAADAASAQAGCYSLQAELNRLQSSDRAGGSARYEKAFREQARVLAATENQAQQAGCFGGGFLFFRNQPAAQCRSLVPKIRDMRANLAKLDRLRRSPGAAPSNERRISQIKAIIASRGCNAPSRREQAVERAPIQSRGTFRTLCVRTCDGYYFPISFATTRSHLEEDAGLCEARCPGAEAKLFTYSNPGQGPEQMVGLDGKYYADMPTAFRYRSTFDASCTCKSGVPSLATNVPGGGALVSVAVADPDPPIPGPRPAPGEDPETIDNRMGGFSFDRTPVAVAQSTTTISGGKQVRVVGPALWDSPEQEGVVIAPVPN